MQKHYLLWEILRGLPDLGWELKMFSKWSLGITFKNRESVRVGTGDETEYFFQRKSYWILKIKQPTKQNSEVGTQSTKHNNIDSYCII